MDSGERIRRVEAIQRRSCPQAGKRAMLRLPRLVAFPGPCLRLPFDTKGTNDIPASDAASDHVGEVEMDAPRPARDELRLDDARAAPTSLEDFTAGVVASAAETMSMLAEHRASRSLSLRPSREARILRLVDAILATGARAISDVLGWWELTRDDGYPWTAWPPVFLLGLVEGPEGLLAIERFVESLRPEEAAAGRAVVDALAVVPHPGIGALAEDLLDAENPLARAVGLEVLSRRAALDVERVAPYLDSEAPALLAAALRALVRIEAAPPRLEGALPLLGHPDPEVAWEAARAVTLWGAPDALRAIRGGQPLASMLGAQAVELFVMAGAAEDIAHIEAIVTRWPLSPEVLDAIGRFGNPLAWSFLLHYLADSEFADAAEKALLTLFGPLLMPEEAKSPSAWRGALMDRDLDPAARYRCGEPWTPGIVVSECDSAGLSQRGIERRLDELEARTGIPMSVDLALWSPTASTKLLATIERSHRARWRPGSWSGGDAERRGR